MQVNKCVGIVSPSLNEIPNIVTNESMDSLQTQPPLIAIL